MSVRQGIIAAVLRVRKAVLAGRRRELAEVPARPAPPRVVGARPETIAGVPCWRVGDGPADTVLLYLHGGSYVSPAVGIQWRGIAAIAAATGLPALLVDYALAAEARYPVALQQVRAVAAELRARGVRRVVLIGDSAGGGLAVATAAALRDDPRATGAEALVLLSPWLDVTVSTPGAAELAPRDVMLSLDRLRAAGVFYAGDADPRTPGVSPLFGSAAGLPPAIVHVGSDEVLLPEARVWADQVRQAGGDVELHVVPGGFHVGAAFPWLPEAARARREQAAFLRRVLPG